jgi:predicted permease
MSAMLQDLRQTARALRKSPGTCAVVVVTSALGICAVATVFSILDAFLLKPLPGVARQAELVNVHATAPDGSSFHSVSLATYRDLRDGSPVFTDISAFASRLVSLSTGGDPSLAVAQIVTGSTFSVLGVTPALGRFFLPGEDAVPGRDAVAVISHRLWQQHLAGDPAAVGRKVSINGHPFTIVGVAPAGFVGTFLGQPFDLWIPTMMASAAGVPADRLTDRRIVWLELVGRLRPAVTLEAARRAVSARAGELAQAYPDIYKGVGYDLLPTTGFEDSLRSAAIPFFAVLMGLAVLVLTIAGVNVSALLLARSVGRERELGVRVALGAGRGRLLRHLVLENVLLFLGGGAVGILGTFATTSLLGRVELPTPVPLAFDLQPGPRVLLFALLASIAAGLAFGLAGTVTALQPSSLASLRAAAATDRRSTSRLRSAFVAAQVALSAVLLVAAGLLFRTVRQAASISPGFDPDGLTMTTVDFRMLGVDSSRAGAAYEALQSRIASLPGVQSAATAGVLPLGPGSRSDAVSLPGAPADEPPRSVDLCDVGDSYFATMRLPILAGRAFGPAEGAGGSPSAIVNETLAGKLWPGREPLGRTIVWNKTLLTVVGVARDSKYRRLWEAPRPFLYLSDRQFGSLRRDLVVRGGGDAASVASALRREIRSVAPGLALSAVLPVRRYIGFSTLTQRVGSAVAGALGAVGLTLAALGVWAQVAFSVSRRTREIGIRMALGARPAQVVRLETARGGRAAAVGLAFGLGAALLSARLLASLLFGVSPADPLTFAAVALVLAAITLAASYAPARRAARVDPNEALRSD